MKIYKFEVTPLTSFLTYPKGDMLYSFFVYWWIKEKKDISIIDKIIFSDFLPKDFFPKPLIPMNYFTNDEDKRKELKSKKWIKDLNDLKSIFEVKLKKKDELVEFFDVDLNVRNSLNRITFKTDEDFSVYANKEYNFNYPIDLYVATDLEIDKIEKFLNQIGNYGFGKNSNLKGKFQLKLVEQCNWSKKKYGLALSPLVSKNLLCYDVFTRFGKYAYSKTPFKKPVLMADTGSIVKFSDFLDGKILENAKNSVIQAKAIVYPFDLRKENEN